eukprot:scaffold142272_cov33-Prasinocladus_malaysianus.AAC.2
MAICHAFAQSTKLALFEEQVRESSLSMVLSCQVCRCIGQSGWRGSPNESLGPFCRAAGAKSGGGHEGAAGEARGGG